MLPIQTRQCLSSEIRSLQKTFGKNGRNGGGQHPLKCVSQLQIKLIVNSMYIDIARAIATFATAPRLVINHRAKSTQF